MYSAKAIANYFLDLGDDENIDITPMQIQKLVYIAHGYHLAKADFPLISDRIEAWRYGPVIPVLYEEFSHLGSEAIYERAYEEVIATIRNPISIDANTETESILNAVWGKYKMCDALELSTLTHRRNSPWHLTKKRGWNRIKNNPPIDDKTIKDYYRKQLEDDAN